MRWHYGQEFVHDHYLLPLSLLWVRTALAQEKAEQEVITAINALKQREQWLANAQKALAQQENAFDKDLQRLQQEQQDVFLLTTVCRLTCVYCVYSLFNLVSDGRCLVLN